MTLAVTISNLLGAFFFVCAAFMAVQAIRGCMGGWMYAGGMSKVYRNQHPNRFIFGLCLHIFFVVLLVYLGWRVWS
jgi:hypothetical protein